MIVDLIDVEEYDSVAVLAAIEVTDDEGEVRRVAHYIPRETMEWRACEYGIDPEDTETLVDVVIHEPHAKTDEAERLCGLGQVREAREALLGAINAHKAEGERQRGAARRPAPEGRESARQKLLALCPIDPEVMEHKREMLAIMRDRVAREKAANVSLAVPLPTSKERAEAFGRMLKEMKDAADANA